MRVKSQNVRPQICLHVVQTIFRQLIKQTSIGPVTEHIFPGARRVSSVEVEIRQVKFAGLNFMKQIAVFVRGSVNALDI